MLPGAIIPGGGCEAWQNPELAAQRQSLRAAVDAAEARLAEAQAVLDAAPQAEARLREAALAEGVTPEDYGRLSQELENVETARREAKAVVDASLQTAQSLQKQLDSLPPEPNAGELIGAVGTAVGPLIPGPAGAAITVGSLLLTSLFGGAAVREHWRRRQSDGALTSVVRAIEAEKDDRGVVDFGDEVVKTSLRSRMSPEAMRLVEEARQARPRKPPRLLPSRLEPLPVQAVASPSDDDVVIPSA